MYRLYYILFLFSSVCIASEKKEYHISFYEASVGDDYIPRFAAKGKEFRSGLAMLRVVNSREVDYQNAKWEINGKVYYGDKVFIFAHPNTKISAFAVLENGTRLTREFSIFQREKCCVHKADKGEKGYHKCIHLNIEGGFILPRKERIISFFPKDTDKRMTVSNLYTIEKPRFEIYPSWNVSDKSEVSSIESRPNEIKISGEKMSWNISKLINIEERVLYSHIFYPRFVIKNSEKMYGKEYISSCSPYFWFGIGKVNIKLPKQLVNVGIVNEKAKYNKFVDVEKGSVSFDDLPPGEYKITVRKADIPVKSSSFTINKDGQIVDVDLSVEVRI